MSYFLSPFIKHNFNFNSLSFTMIHPPIKATTWCAVGLSVVYFNTSLTILSPYQGRTQRISQWQKKFSWMGFKHCIICSVIKHYFKPQALFLSKKKGGYFFFWFWDMTIAKRLLEVKAITPTMRWNDFWKHSLIQKSLTQCFMFAPILNINHYHFFLLKE